MLLNFGRLKASRYELNLVDSDAELLMVSIFPRSPRIIATFQKCASKRKKDSKRNVIEAQ